MKKALILVVALVICLSISIVSFAEWSIIYDGYIEQFDTYEEALANYSGQGSIWLTREIGYSEVYSPEENSLADDEYEFWLGVYDEINCTNENAILDVDCYGYPNMSVFVMKALQEHQTIGLAIHSDFGDFIIPPGYLVEIENGRVTYPVCQLFLLYSDMSNWGIGDIDVQQLEHVEKDVKKEIEPKEAKKEIPTDAEKIEEKYQEKDKVEEKKVVPQNLNDEGIYIMVIALLSVLTIILIVAERKRKKSSEEMNVL